jgi:dTDP-4-dehydrorhamnose 3,5-epimerase
MKFTETSLPGVFVIDLERHEDDRGFFARSWCRETLARRGLRADLAQCSYSYNTRSGTLRGMHYQAAPRAETKIVSCVRGAIYDVALDLRPESPTFRKWTAATLTADTLRMLYVPEGCAHGFQTLTPEALVHYQIADEYSPEHSRGVRWNDPAFAIEWPAASERILSGRDAGYPDFVP